MDPYDPLDQLLHRHSPDRPDDIRLTDARVGLEASIGLAGATMSDDDAPAPPPLRPRRRSLGRRLAVPVAAAVTLGIAISLWPTPTAPSAFADWSPTPRSDLPESTSQSLVGHCTDRLIESEIVMTELREHELALAVEAERRHAEEEARAEADRAVQEAERVEREEGPSAALDVAVVDARGEWSLVVLATDTGADGAAVQVECLVDGNGTASISSGLTVVSMGGSGAPNGTLIDGPAQEPQLLSVHSVSSPGWAQTTGTVSSGTAKVDVQMQDGTSVEATLSGVVGSSGDLANAPVRTFAAWWPTPDGSSQADVVVLSAEDGTVVTHELDQ